MPVIKKIRDPVFLTIVMNLYTGVIPQLKFFKQTTNKSRNLQVAKIFAQVLTSHAHIFGLIFKMNHFEK